MLSDLVTVMAVETQADRMAPHGEAAVHLIVERAKIGSASRT